MDTFKCCTWAHFALSGIQKGVQSAHAMGELILDGNELAKDWLRNHKTVLFFDGGATGELAKKYLILSEAFSGSQIPFASFQEDQYTLGGITTAIGTIIPDSIRFKWDTFLLFNASGSTCGVVESAWKSAQKYGISNRDAWIRFNEMITKSKLAS